MPGITLDEARRRARERAGRDEPTRLYSVVRDRDGALWMRGRRWWYCQEGPGKLIWDSLADQYGPLTTDTETERRQALGSLGGRARD